MKYIAELLFLCAVKSICSKSIQKSEQDSQEVDILIGKILHAHKFNELADRIADRAVIKLNDFQKSTKTLNEYNVHHSTLPKIDNVNLNAESRRQKKHKHGKIDVDAVLEQKVLPIDGLKLRYKHLKDVHFNTDKPVMKDHDTLSALSFENKDYNKIAEVVKQDFDDIKTRSNENYGNPFGNSGTMPWHENQPKVSLDTESQSRQHDKLEEITEDESESAENSQNASLLNSQNIRTGETQFEESQNPSSKLIRKEGDKALVWVESPDYKEYHEQLAKIKNL